MNTLFIRRDEKVIGPVTVDQLKQSIANGNLLNTDYVSESKEGPWHLVEKVALLKKIMLQQEQELAPQQGKVLEEAILTALESTDSEQSYDNSNEQDELRLVPQIGLDDEIEDDLQCQSEDYDGYGVLRLMVKIMRTGSYKIIAGVYSPEKQAYIEGRYDETFLSGDTGDQVPVTLRFDLPEVEHTWKYDYSPEPTHQFPTIKEEVEEVKCFVATSCYGSADHHVVECLRRFRDTALQRSGLGRHFIKWYYTHGPRAATWLDNNGWLKPVVRAALTVFATSWWLLYSIYVRTTGPTDPPPKQRI